MLPLAGELQNAATCWRTAKCCRISAAFKDSMPGRYLQCPENQLYWWLYILSLTRKGQSFPEECQLARENQHFCPQKARCGLLAFSHFSR
jgi:hypothetical protein